MGTSTVRHHRRGTMLVALLAVLLLVSACTQEGRDELASEAESLVDRVESEVERSPDVEPTTEAPATEPPQTEAPATSDSEPTEDSLDLSEWLPWILGLVALLLLWWLIASAMRRRGDARRASSQHHRAAIADLVGTGRWVVDQGTTEVMRTTDPRQLDRSWQMVRDRLVGLEEQASRLFVESEGEPGMPAVAALGTASADLRSALDGDVALRQDSGAADDLVAQSRRTVRQRRQDFAAAVDRLAGLR